MKKLLLVFALSGALLGFNGCVEDPPPPETPVETRLRLLSTTWSYKDATLDAVRQPGYENFKLTMQGAPGAADYGYVTVGRPALSPWASSGTWRFGDDFESHIKRENDLDIMYAMSSDGSALEISFIYYGDGFSRAAAVKGNWVFTFTRGQNSN
ncbi:MAG TPA: hypothetical protein VFE50_15720 [Cyclobacteriaceae bacterium]|nr:hypothetical protein [Cyclobacteriaceae bacterium]